MWSQIILSAGDHLYHLARSDITMASFPHNFPHRPRVIASAFAQRSITKPEHTVRPQITFNTSSLSFFFYLCIRHSSCSLFFFPLSPLFAHLYTSFVRRPADPRDCSLLVSLSLVDMQSCALRWRGGIRGCGAAAHGSDKGCAATRSTTRDGCFYVRACIFPFALKASLHKYLLGLIHPTCWKWCSSCIVSNLQASLWLQDNALSTLATLPLGSEEFIFLFYGPLIFWFVINLSHKKLLSTNTEPINCFQQSLWSQLLNPGPLISELVVILIIIAPLIRFYAIWTALMSAVWALIDSRDWQFARVALSCFGLHAVH